MSEHTKLTYDNQLEFENWAKRKGLSKKNGVEFYFDCVTPVDATKENQPDIPGFEADGSVTWGRALEILRKYFKRQLARAAAKAEAKSKAKPAKKKPAKRGRPAGQSQNKKYAVVISRPSTAKQNGFRQLVHYMAKTPKEAAAKAFDWFFGYGAGFLHGDQRFAEDAKVVYRVKERGMPRGEGVTVFKQGAFLKSRVA